MTARPDKLVNIYDTVFSDEECLPMRPKSPLAAFALVPPTLMPARRALQVSMRFPIVNKRTIYENDCLYGVGLDMNNFEGQDAELSTSVGEDNGYYIRCWERTIRKPREDVSTATDEYSTEPQEVFQKERLLLHMMSSVSLLSSIHIVNMAGAKISDDDDGDGGMMVGQ